MRPSTRERKRQTADTKSTEPYQLLHNVSGIVSDSDHETNWTTALAEELYFVREWGDEYFSVNDAGHVVVQPVRGSDLRIDLYEVVSQLRERGSSFPLLIRFQDLLKSRVRHLNEAFHAAISETRYKGTYQGVFPVKVNQLREVVEEILVSGEPYSFGLECGSKSELVATLPYLASHDTLLICNGCKDRIMYRLLLAGQRLGQNVIPVVERKDEVDLLLSEAQRADMTADYGIRVRLSTSGAGLWSESGGENSKFGLSLSELLDLLNRQENESLPIRPRLLHFHLGSQIADLENVGRAAEEAARIYTWMQKRYHDVRYMDVGGGLGVAYEAGNPDALGTINYTLDEYAMTIVESIRRVCDADGAPHPVIVSESGRAVAAHHSVLIIEAVSSRHKELPLSIEEPESSSAVLQEIYEIYRRVTEDDVSDDLSVLEALYVRCEELRLEMVRLFRAGKISVEQKSGFEQTFWADCILIDHLVRDVDGAARTPQLADLERRLTDHYLCNFSVFRSMVDHWAIGQRFPIMPIHRLSEVPRRRGILVDLTCDSDGKVVTFVSPSGDKRFLELHDINPDAPYYLGIFLMGAYQDIMGDMHNLFGRVTEAHVYADAEEPGNFYIEEMLTGASVEEQLALVQYHPNDLERRMGDLIHQAVNRGRLRPKEGVKLLNQYRQIFRSMTYLTTDEES